MRRRRLFWERTTPVFWCMTERGVFMGLSSHFIKAEMIQIASPAAAQFPWDVKTLLHRGLRLRDRYHDQEGSVSPHGLAVATGRQEAQLDRLLDRHFRRSGERAELLAPI
jgi:hypothetical protein